MIRIILFLVLFILVARMFWRVVDNIIEGATGRPPRGGGRIPDRGTQMVRDPVCGTFIVPDDSLAIADRRGRVYFCSAACRDKYRARTA